MQDNGTSVLDPPEATQVGPVTVTTAREALISQVRELPYGELAVALYASSMPTSRAARGNLTAEQIETWAAEGLAQLGAVQVWRLTWRTRKGASPEHEAIWPSARRPRRGVGIPGCAPLARARAGNPHLGRRLVGDHLRNHTQPAGHRIRPTARLAFKHSGCHLKPPRTGRPRLLPGPFS
jgi:hypothetical protein